MEKSPTPSHNNRTKHVSLDQLKKEAAANKLREHDAETAHEQAVQASKAINPLEDINVLAKAPKGYDESNGPWKAENPDNGFDGAADLASIAEAVAKDPSRQYASWEKTFVNHMKNEASVLKEKSKIDFAALNTKREGDADGTDPMDNRLGEIYAKLDEKFNQAGTGAQADLLRKTIKSQMQDVQTFRYYQRNPNEVPYAVSGSVLKNYANGGKFEEIMKIKTGHQQEKETKRAGGINTEIQTLEAKLATAQDAGEFAVMNDQLDALKETLGDTLPMPEWTNEQRTQRNTQIAMLGERRKANTRDINVYRLLAQEFPLAPETPKDDVEENLEGAAEEASLSEAMTELMDNEEALRLNLADLNASRLLTASGLDSRADSRIGDKAAEYRRAKEAHKEAGQALLMQKIVERSKGEGFKTDAELNLFIAEQTLNMYGKLEDDTIDNVSTKNRRLGKVMNFLAGRTADGEKDTSTRNKVVRRLIKGTVGIGLAAASVATGGALPVAIAAGGWAGVNMYASLDAKAKSKWLNKEDSALSQSELLAASESAPTSGTDENGNKVEFKNIKKAVNKIEAAANAASGMIEKDVKSEQKRRALRLGGSALFGGAIGSASALLGGQLNGGESTANVAPTPDVLPTPDIAPVADIIPTDAAANFGPNNFVVNPGDGFNNLFQNMNIPQDQWASVMDKVGPDLLQSGDAYTMADGSIGIANPGQLSQHAFDVIMSAR